MDYICIIGRKVCTQNYILYLQHEYNYFTELKCIRIQIQDTAAKREYWGDVVHTLTEEYSEIMQLYDIELCLNVYKN